MELADYLGRIWRWKWVVIGIALVVAALTTMVVYFLPRHYVATTALEVGGIKSLLVQPGEYRDTSRQTLPSAIQAETQTYLNILDTPGVAEKARKEASKQLASTDEEGDSKTATVESESGTVGTASTSNGESRTIGTTSTSNSESRTIGATEDSTGTTAASASAGETETDASIDFDYTYRSEANSSGADIIYIDVYAQDARTAKVVADSLAQVLVEESKNLDEKMADDFVSSIENSEIADINKRLAEVRQETEILSLDASVDPIEKNVRIANLEDEALSLENLSKQYYDIIARVRLNEALELNNLSIVSLAALPRTMTSPQYLRVSVVAATVGLLIGIISVMFIDRKKNSWVSR